MQTWFTLTAGMDAPYQVAQIARKGYLQHPSLGLCGYELTEVSGDPDTQVAQVIGYMKGYAADDSRSQSIAQDATMARGLGTGDPIADTWGYLSRYGGIRGMQFQRDEQLGAQCDLDRWNPLVETLIRPADQARLARPIGDCDDFAMYGAAHLLYKGVPCSFVTIAADSSAPDMFSHVYLAAYPNSGPNAGRRVPLDLSHGEFPGWEHREAYRIQEWPIGRTPVSALLAVGLGGYLLYRALKGGVN